MKISFSVLILFGLIWFTFQWHLEQQVVARNLWEFGNGLSMSTPVGALNAKQKQKLPESCTDEENHIWTSYGAENNMKTRCLTPFQFHFAWTWGHDIEAIDLR